MKNIEYLAIAVAVAGGLFNRWNLPGGDILLIIGLIVLAIMYAFSGKIFSKIQERRGNIMPLIVFSSLSLAIGVLSLLFSHMNWDFRGLLAIISFVALPITLIFSVYQLMQKNENPLYKMIAIRSAVLLVALIAF